jgi:hypothetical protein
MHHAPATVPPRLPIVVQVGFAGSRLLFAPQRLPAAQTAALEADLLGQLIERLQALPATLGLTTMHRLCGVSQLAIGADTVFTRALMALGLPQRLVLPQARDAFLAAGADSDPDFTADERETALGLMSSSHIIELRVGSDAAERSEQFEDSNSEILRDSDVVVCLLRAGAHARAGGTVELAEHARQAGKTVLLLEVTLAEGRPRLSAWRSDSAASFVAPGMPRELADCAPALAEPAWPTAAEFLDPLRRCASARTREHSGLFKRAAITIIVLHIVATLLAALAGIGGVGWWIAALLALELVLLGIGLRSHHALHRSAAVRSWAVTRLLAETLRSMQSASATSASLDYALALDFPASFRPLLRTAAVLHARDLRLGAVADWQAQRARYLDERLLGAQGQLAYFTRAAASAARRRRWAHTGFWLFSGAAFVATGAKLASVADVLPSALIPAVAAWGGLLAITLPVAAVGFLSWAAASDLEARAATYADMRTFLARQADRLRKAATAREFIRLVRETELGILGETLGWFSRRLFKGVA